MVPPTVPPKFISLFLDFCLLRLGSASIGGMTPGFFTKRKNNNEGKMMNLTPEQLEAKKKEIREGNDLLRTTFFPFLGKVCFTDGVNLHPKKDEILTAVREFYQFDAGNDPHHEHDFGHVEVESESGCLCLTRNKRFEKFYFKIDYHDLELNFGADPYTETFRRVLTIMAASEY